jgi:hypothetical protein
VKFLLLHGADANPVWHELNFTNRMVEFNQLQNCLRTYGLTNLEERGYDMYTSRIRPVLSASPLQLAVANRHFEIARLLVQHGAKVDLASAASLGMTEVIQRALRSEPKRVNEYTVWGSWRFQIIEREGLQWDPGSNVQSGTPLHFAVRANQPKTVKYLLEAGADRSMLDDEGRTPKRLAEELKLPEIVALFQSAK